MSIDYVKAKVQSEVTAWEYRIIHAKVTFWSSRPRRNFLKQLNTLGREGWEVVGVTSQYWHLYSAVLKRAVSAKTGPENSEFLEKLALPH